MITEMLVDDLIEKDSRKYPHFLSKHIVVHQEIMAQIFSIFQIYKDLNQSEFIHDDLIARVAKLIHKKLELIKTKDNSEIYYKTLDHLRYKLAYYIQLNTQLENFEECANLRKLEILVFQIKENPSNN